MKGVGLIRNQMALRGMQEMPADAWKKIGKNVAKKQELVIKIFEYDRKHKPKK